MCAGAARRAQAGVSDATVGFAQMKFRFFSFGNPIFNFDFFSGKTTKDNGINYFLNNIFISLKEETQTNFRIGNEMQLRAAVNPPVYSVIDQMKMNPEGLLR